MCAPNIVSVHLCHRASSNRVLDIGWRSPYEKEKQNKKTKKIPVQNKTSEEDSVDKHTKRNQEKRNKWKQRERGEKHEAKRKKGEKQKKEEVKVKRKQHSANKKNENHAAQTSEQLMCHRDPVGRMGLQEKHSDGLAIAFLHVPGKRSRRHILSRKRNFAIWADPRTPSRKASDNRKANYVQFTIVHVVRESKPMKTGDNNKHQAANTNKTKRNERRKQKIQAKTEHIFVNTHRDHLYYLVLQEKQKNIRI